MQVTVQVRPDVARVLQRGLPVRNGPADASQALLGAAKELGVELRPIHPGAKDPYLLPYFTVEVPDPATAERVIARLRRHEAVEGAYVKPPDEAPGD
jgi:hypothetical protein